ncbi:MAG: MarR family winged helix-turn-helix transcriptional regulator [Megasphaera sp.]|jgi:DNA-binding MarR family transcriptional regulator|nr:MarR family winged helix-turn-helix transcriptional regulator [Megasphaera sp.]MCH4188014.1 MarR family winged helix-turn-helix transcriptional regulator [Megasphaera sp.]MCH4217114.1 MarR family winged helix-turn-helix transcriptional regulator [Megasphaera sp.]
MKFIIFPTRDELECHAKQIPEIDPSAVLAMLRISQAQEEIRASISDVLERQYSLSEGKLRVMIVLHQWPQGIAPSVLAAKTGVTRATISAMVHRMIRDGYVSSVADDTDKRGKKLMLTQQGRDFMDTILPDHYARISKTMGKLSEEEQQELIHLLEKLSS